MLDGFGKIRNLGGMRFIDLRDEFGITQIVMENNEKTEEMCKDLTTESCISVDGKVVENRIIELKYKSTKKAKVNLVFVKDNGRYIGTDLIRYPYRIIHHELGINNCRFYDLRGSFATKTLRSGVEIKDVAEVLGHSRVETTENYYVSTTKESKKHVSNVLEKQIDEEIIKKFIK